MEGRNVFLTNLLIVSAILTITAKSLGLFKDLNDPFYKPHVEGYLTVPHRSDRVSNRTPIPFDSVANWQISEVDALIRRASRGDVAAQVRLGEMYRYGENPPPDPATALYWFDQAARLGDAQAMLHIGQMYVTGREVFQDCRYGAYMLNRAYAAGSWRAMNVLLSSPCAPR